MTKAEIMSEWEKFKETMPNFRPKEAWGMADVSGPVGTSVRAAAAKWDDKLFEIVGKLVEYRGETGDNIDRDVTKLINQACIMFRDATTGDIYNGLEVIKGREWR